MTVNTSRSDTRNALTLELAVLQLAQAVIDLGQAVQRLAAKEHLDLPEGRDDEEYKSIMNSVTKARMELERVVETLSDG